MTKDSRMLNMSGQLRQAKQEQVVQLIKDKKWAEAIAINMEMLDNDHNDAAALFQLSKVMLEQKNKGFAYNLMARACKLEPDIPEMWFQYAQCQEEKPEGWKSAEWCFRKAIKLAEKHGKQMPFAWSSIGAIYYLRGEYTKALQALDKSLEIESDHQHALITKSFCYLAMREWPKAWELYDYMLAQGKRERYAYGDEPEWDGLPGKKIIISGEQGLGDELMYGSCIQEVIDSSREVIVECMPRLEKIFKRSFPGAKAVYGTRWDMEVVWGEDHNPDAHVAMASIPRFFRQSDADFHGNAYLKPDPDIVDAVRGIFDKLSNRPKIGIAWTGGSTETRGHLRERTLEELTPILREPGIDFISLEYYDRTEEIGDYYQSRKIPIHTYEWLTKRGLDYDLTAGLISQLDLLISVPTTNVQGAGGLGVPCWVLVPKYTGWMFANDDYPWASSVTPLRNISIKEISERLKRWMYERKQAVA